MSTKSNDSVVLGLDIPKTRKAIADDLKRVLKNLKTPPLTITDVNTDNITHSLAKTLQKAYADAFSSLSPPDIPLEDWEKYLIGIQDALSEIGRKAGSIPDLKPLLEVCNAFEKLSGLYPDSSGTSSIEGLIEAAAELEDALNRLKENWDTTISVLTSNNASVGSKAFNGLSTSLDSFMKKLGEIPGSFLANYNIKNSGGFDKTIIILS